MRISCSCERVAGLDGKPCVRQGPLDPSRLDKPLISLIDANDEPKERRDGRKKLSEGRSIRIRRMDFVPPRFIIGDFR